MKMTARSHAASELPLEELLALYGYEVLDPLLHSDKDTCQLAASLPDMTLDKDQITNDLFPEEEEEESSADDLTPSVTSNTSELLRRLQGGDKGMLISSSSEEESDDDSNASSASNDGRKDIMVGSMYQAKIPPISPYTFQDRAQDGEDQLLWSPGVLPVQEVEEYLLCAQIPGCQEGAARSTRLPGDTIRDNEQALYELVKCNFSVEEALRRLRFNVKVYREELCAWSEQECRNFEHGYRVYGKNFHLIQGNKVRTRSVGECVEYYYMWKKSERHEYFTQQASKLTRRKYNMHMEEDGDQDGEVGELVGGGNSQDSGSQGSLGAVQLESSSLPPQGLELDKQGGGPSPEETNTTLSLKAMNLVRTGLRKQACAVGGQGMYAGGCPQQLFRCPFSLLSPVEDPREPAGPGACPLSNSQLQAQPSSPHSSSLQQPCGGGPPSPTEEDHGHILGSGFYQLQFYGPFIPEGPGHCATTAGSGNGLPRRGLQMDFSLPSSSSSSPPSSALLPSDFGGYGAILCSSPMQRPTRSLTQ